MARILRLTLPAPDLVEAILEGTEPDGLSLEKLYRAPVAWGEQRTVVERETYVHPAVAALGGMVRPSANDNACQPSRAAAILAENGEGR